MNLTPSTPEELDRIFYQSATSKLGCLLSIAEYIASEHSYENLVAVLTGKIRYDVEDILDFCDDHEINFYPYTLERPIGPQPLRLELNDDVVTRVKFMLEFP